MGTSDINHVLKLYLGADATGGFQPIGCDERLQSAFPGDYTRMMELMSPYLTEDQPQDVWWSASTLSQAADRFAERLQQKFPELDAISIRALANRRAFDYK
jgi:hypothetical protein